MQIKNLVGKEGAEILIARIHPRIAIGMAPWSVHKSMGLSIPSSLASLPVDWREKDGRKKVERREIATLYGASIT